MVKSRILTLVWFLFTSTLTFAAGINVVPTAAASQQGQLLNAPNGVPIINIAPPNAKGLSHNKYHDFNVEQQGLILNNSQTVQRSQIGGVIANNPRLMGGSAASVILNEVTGTRRSSLNGPLEVHGQRAEVIIANPNGINVNGGSFINTPRATLTTGLPQITDGALQGFDVNGGDVAIEGLGLNTTQADVVDIMARSISLNAELHANTVNMVTGRTEIDYATRAATKKADNGSAKPTFALDSSALGGMYVGRIALVGTEQGVGVNLQGFVTTNVGDMSLSADGKITLKKITAEGAVKLNAANNDIDITETIAKQNIEFTGNFISLADQGKLEAGAELKVNSTTFSATNAKINANEATLNTTAINNNGSIINVVDRLTIATSTLDNQGDIVAGGETEITATTRLTNQKPIQSGDTLKLTTALLENQTNAEIISDGSQTLLIDTLNNDGTISSNNDVDINSTTVNNTGKVSADGKLNLTAASLSNTSSAKLLSQLDMQLDVTDIDNAGEIATAKNLLANVNNNLTNSGLLYSQDDMSLYVNNVLHNNEGAIYLVNGDLMIAKNTVGEKTERITNDSGIIETEVGDITLKTKVLENKRARFNIIQNTTFNQTHVTQWGTLPALGSTPDFIASPAWYAYFNNYFITVPDPADPVTYNPSYYSMADDDGAPVYGQIRVQGKTTKLDPANSSAAALISAGDNLSIDANTITNHSSQIAAGGDMNLTGNSLSNTGYDLFTNYYYMAVANDGVRRIGGRGINVNSFADLNVYKLIFSTSEGSVRSTFLAEGSINGDFNAQIDNTNIQAFANPSDINTGVTPASIQGLSNLLLDPATVDAGPVQQALTAINHLNGLFITAPDFADYIVETRSSFVDFGKFFGSDYFLNQTNYDLDDEVRFLGDAFYETKLVEQQVRDQTSQRFLYGSNGIEQMKQLLDNGLQVSENQELAFGVALTPAQIDALNSDIVWYVEQSINGKRAMVPVLYLANSTRMALTPGGALMAANDIDIDAGFGINNSGTIDAVDDLVMNARIGINNNGGAITAGNDLELRSTYGDISNEGVSATSTYGARNFETRELSRGKIEAGRDVKLGAGNNIRNIASDIKAGGDLKLDAGNNVLIGAREDKSEYYSDVNGTHWGKFTRNSTSNLNAGGNLEIDSDELTLIQGGKLKSGDNLTVRTGGDLIVDTVVNTSEQEGKSEKSGGFFGGSSSRYFYRNQVTNLQAQLESGGDLNLKAQENLALLSPQLKADGNVSLEAVDGTVTLGSTKDSDYEHSEYHKQGFVSWKSGNEGHHLEKVRHTEITAGGDILIDAGNGVVIELKHDGSLQDSIKSLSQLPELAWMAELRDRDDIDWKTIEEQHKYWSQHESGIGGPGITLISMAIGIASGGLGFADLATSLGIESAAGIAAFEAGMTTLVQNAGVSLIANGGDIGATFKDILSSDNLLSIATASLTAGLTNSIDAKLNLDGNNLTLAQHIQKGIVDSVISSGVNTALNGGDFASNFLNSFKNVTTSNLATELIGNIGDLQRNSNGEIQEGGLVKILSHATIGCTAQSLAGGSCTAGALGAATAEFLAPHLSNSELTKVESELTVLFGSSIAALLAGEDLDSAITAGIQVERFNRQLHLEEAIALKGEKDKVNQSNLSDSEKEELIAKLEAVSCAFVHCSEGVSTNDANYEKIAKKQAYGEQLRVNNDPAYQAISKHYYNGLFVYTNRDSINDFLTRHEEGVERTVGTVQTISSGVGTVGGVALTVASAPTCPTTGLGCAITVGGVTITGLEAARFIEGLSKTFGEYELASGENVLASFNPDTHPGEINPLGDVLTSAGLSVVEYGVGKILIKTASGFRAFIDKFTGKSFESGLGNSTRLTDVELATGQRLESKLGIKLKESEHIGAEYVDDLGRSYDALGNPKASEFWNPNEFFASIDDHLLKSNDYTVIDLTDFTTSQIAEVNQYLNDFPVEHINKIIKIGFE
ncbi:MAG: filamentous hemagglutinin N-terminal domain-containing protein [Proteobacteria bacterium]|nr:filamentous hemagglutinin N-terminal domain-containing protein [Pseudomonadota bacterium]NOG59245.1 filamentous hemagglutinin N-terminal domain-containing protein [Pseudomonadota bacterium]